MGFLKRKLINLKNIIIIIMNSNFNLFLYIGFSTLGLYYFIFQNDVNNAVVNFALALAFDPFDEKVSWQNRPVWQKAWLIIHLTLALTGFGVMIFGK